MIGIAVRARFRLLVISSALLSLEPISMPTMEDYDEFVQKFLFENRNVKRFFMSSSEAADLVIQGSQLKLNKKS